MKTQWILLLASTFAISSMNYATAQPLTPDEIFAAIDGEIEIVEDLSLTRSVQPRVNPRINYDFPMRTQSDNSSIDCHSDRENVSTNWFRDDFHLEEDYDDE